MKVVEQQDAHYWCLFLPIQGYYDYRPATNHYAVLPLALSLVKLPGAYGLSDCPVHLSGLATGDIKTSSWILVFRPGIHPLIAGSLQGSGWAPRREYPSGRSNTRKNKGNSKPNLEVYCLICKYTRQTSIETITIINCSPQTHKKQSQC